MSVGVIIAQCNWAIFFSYIMARTSYIRWDNDDDVCL